MRIARCTPPGVVVHVISRFIDRDWLVATSRDRTKYLGLLERALEHSDWKCLAYALMSNHFHFAMIAGHMPCESWTRRTNSPFARWYNELHERIGPMFAGRARMWTSAPEHVGRLIAYIHNNPVRAGISARASECDWTSHRAYTGFVPAPSFLAIDDGLSRIAIAGADFDAWVDAQAGVLLDEPRLENMQRAVHKRGALELATPQRTPLVVPLIARPWAAIRPEPTEVVDVVASILGVPAYRLRGCGRDGRIAERALAVQAGRASGLPLAAMASALGHSPQTASRLGSMRLSNDGLAVFDLVMKRLYRTFSQRETERIDKASPAKRSKLLTSGPTEGGT